MTREVEAFLKRRFQEVYRAGQLGHNREQTIELAVIVTGAMFDAQPPQPTTKETPRHG
jgi:hypothetical protein